MAMSSNRTSGPFRGIHVYEQRVHSQISDLVASLVQNCPCRQALACPIGQRIADRRAMQYAAAEDFGPYTKTALQTSIYLPLLSLSFA